MTLEDRIKLTKSTLKDVDKMRKTKGNKEGIQAPVVPTNTEKTGKTEIHIQPTTTCRSQNPFINEGSEVKASASLPPDSTFHQSNIDNQTTSLYRRVNEALREAVKQGEASSTPEHQS